MGRRESTRIFGKPVSGIGATQSCVSTRALTRSRSNVRPIPAHSLAIPPETGGYSNANSSRSFCSCMLTGLITFGQTPTASEAAFSCRETRTKRTRSAGHRLFIHGFSMTRKKREQATRIGGGTNMMATRTFIHR